MRGGSHSGLLAVTVRTDTERCLSGVVATAASIAALRRKLERGCIAPVLCQLCGLPLKRCRCRVGVDY